MSKTVLNAEALIHIGEAGQRISFVLRKPSMNTQDLKTASHPPSAQPPLVVGMTGASGAIYAKRLLEILKDLGIPSHLVVSRSAEITIAHETHFKVAEIKALATHVAKPEDIAASIASGSFQTRGMIVAPCSIRSMSEIATGVTSSLLTRAADVTLKERRRLVLMVRETPLHVGHLRTMTQLAEMGAIIAPPVPAFYARPVDLAEMIDHTVGRVLDLFDIDSRTVRRWTRDRDSSHDLRVDALLSVCPKT